MKSLSFRMEEVSATFEQAPEITKATEFHTQETIQANKTSHRILLIISSIILLAGFEYLLLYLIKDGFFAARDKPWPLLSYILIKAVLCFQAYILFLNSLMIVRTIVKNIQPESIFVSSLFSKLAKEFSLVMSLLFCYWMPSYDEVLSAPSIIGTLGQLHWLLGTGRFPGIGSATSTESVPGVEGSPVISIPVMKDCPGLERNIILGLIIAVMIIILRDIIIFGLNFNVHYKYYVDRIKKNVEKIGVLKKMNEAINAGYTGDIDVIAQRLVQVISKDGVVITHNDLVPFFDEKTSAKIIEFCSSDDSEVTVEEIKGFYIYTMLEQQKIVKSLEQNNESVLNFRKVLDVLFIPTAFFYFISSVKSADPLGLTKEFNSNFLGALLFSTSYSFSDNIKVFLSSLSFIFFVRPYEVEDIVIINNKAYKVHAINLLTTVLLEESKYTVFPNSFLATQPITNLRLRKTWDEHFTFDFNFEQFEAKRDEFLMKLVGYAKKRSSEFRKKPYFSTITLKEGRKISAKLVVGFNLDVSDLDIIQERKNNFLFTLSRIFQECDLVPYKE